MSAERARQEGGQEGRGLEEGWRRAHRREARPLGPRRGPGQPPRRSGGKAGPAPPPRRCGEEDGDAHLVPVPELLAMIFGYLDVRDKGRAAQVCTAWRDAAYHKSVWRGVEAKLHLRRGQPVAVPQPAGPGHPPGADPELAPQPQLRDPGYGQRRGLNLSGCYVTSPTTGWATRSCRRSARCAR